MSTSGEEFVRRLNKEERRQHRLGKVSRKPAHTKFSQQELGTCKPLLTPASAVMMFLLIGGACIPVGVLTLLASRSVVELVYQYETFCIMKYATPNAPLTTNADKSSYMQDSRNLKNCTVSLIVHEKMKQPIYVYYELGNFFQNHRRYVKSRSDQQLRGSIPSKTDLDNCKPQDTWNGSVVVPCGLIAWSLFNDTYDFSTDGFLNPNNTIPVNKTGISWKTDQDEKFNNTVFPANFVNNAGANASSQIGGASLNASVPLSNDEDLIVWMRTAALPTFRKLYGRIERDLQAGTFLTVNINNLYNTYGFKGRKKIVLSTMSWLGGKNDFLGNAYLAVGGLSILIGLVFLILHWANPRPLGDTSYLSWVRKSSASSTVTM
jgi:hypothetical protein